MKINFFFLCTSIFLLYACGNAWQNINNDKINEDIVNKVVLACEAGTAGPACGAENFSLLNKSMAWHSAQKISAAKNMANLKIIGPDNAKDLVNNNNNNCNSLINPPSASSIASTNTVAIYFPKQNTICSGYNISCMCHL